MIKRIVSTTFWTDGKVIDEFSPEDKYFMLYLLTNPQTTQLGIYELNAKKAAFELGYSVEAVLVLLDRFEEKYSIIKRSKHTNEIAILNYLAYSVVKGGQPVTDLLNKELKQVKDKELIEAIKKHLQERTDLLPTVKNFIESLNENENEKENDNVNDNDNDNDNESTVGRTQQRTVDRTQYRTEYDDSGIIPRGIYDYRITEEEEQDFLMQQRRKIAEVNAKLARGEI